MIQELGNIWKEFSQGRKARMSELGKKYKKVISNVEKNLKNKEDVEYVKSQIDELVNAFSKDFTNIEELVNKVTNRQNEVEEKMNKVEKLVDSIEKDIYLEDEYDLEIVCPYCNFSFMLDSEERKTEVECPECNNVIEIDWDGDSFDDSCIGDCACCGHDCMELQEEEEEKASKKKEKKTKKKQKEETEPEDNEDDM